MPFGQIGNWTYPILQQINRQGDIMLQGHQLEQQEAQNALQRQVLGMQLAERANAMASKRALESALMSAGEGGDLEQIGMKLLQSGRVEGLSLIEKARELKSKDLVKIGPDDTLFDTSKGKEVFRGQQKLQDELSRSLGRVPTYEELLRYKKEVAESSAAKTNIDMKNLLGRETSIGEARLKKIDDLENQANTSKMALNRISQTYQIVNKFGDDVVGLEGNLRAFLAPAAKYIGMDISKADASQMLQLLLKEGAGGLRSQVIGPGPVTNYEQEIMQLVSGGKMSAATGLKLVLEKSYRDHKGQIDRFNSAVENLSKVKGYEQTPTIFSKVEYGELPSESVKTKPIKKEIVDRGTFNGRPVVKYSDGSIEYAGED